MNKNNYGSVEACQRLIAAGITLATDAVWGSKNGCEFQLINTEDVGKIGGLTIIPAVNLAEVWRELPEETFFRMGYLRIGKDGLETYLEIPFWGQFTNTNPTDALIDLLILVTKNFGTHTIAHYSGGGGQGGGGGGGATSTGAEGGNGLSGLGTALKQEEAPYMLYQFKKEEVKDE